MKFANLTWRVCFVAWLGSVALASDARSPLRVTRVDPARETVEVELEPAALDPLERAGHVVMRGVALPNGVSLDLELQHVVLARHEIEFYVDGQPAPHLLDGISQSLWTGRVAGASDSEVMLAFSSVGCRGWIRHAGVLFHLLPDEGTPHARWTTEDALASAGLLAKFECGVDDDSAPPSPPGGITEATHGGPLFFTTTLYRCKIAVETDYQLNQRFAGNLMAQASYLAMLLAAVGYRYEEQLQLVLTFPYVGLYSTPSDPWMTPDIPGTASEMKAEFRAKWNSIGFPVAGAAIGTFLSGAAIGGGVATINSACDHDNRYSVCGNLTLQGMTPFPIQVGPLNWDFYVVAHELGHNLGAYHTHAYCPPIDECPPMQYWLPCQTQQVCITNGTIMSYCHHCPGGYSNISTYFHPVSVASMRAFIETSCLNLYVPDPVSYCTAKVNSLGCTPRIGHSGHPTLSGLDDFRVRCEQVLNNKNGLLVWSTVSANQPFQGGTKCVGSPLSKSVMLHSGGSAGGNDCTGVYDVAFSHAFLGAHGLTGGTTFYAQFWMRDPASSGTIGLSDGLAIVVAN